MIYENIVKLCAANGISIMQLEKACDIGNGTIGGWRKGNPRFDLLKRVAGYFGISVDELTKEGE